MENYWTSNKSINGLRHFVLVNETKEKGNISFLMVSVLDSEINLKTTYEELINSGNWHKGWINLSKHQSITEEYVNYKSIYKREGIDEIFINEDSLFNIETIRLPEIEILLNYEVKTGNPIVAVVMRAPAKIKKGRKG